MWPSATRSPSWSVAEPRASRPASPDWLGGEEFLQWSWAVDRLTRERNYWVASVRMDGRPQSRPVWGVWSDDVLLLSVGEAGFRRARREPDGTIEVSVNVDSARDVVILEGAAGRTIDVSAEALAAYNRKYDWDLTAGMLNFVVRPRVVYGWRDEDVKTATRWTFE